MNFQQQTAPREVHLFQVHLKMVDQEQSVTWLHPVSLHPSLLKQSIREHEWSSIQLLSS